MHVVTEATRPCICYISEFLLTGTRVLMDYGLILKNFSEVLQTNLLLSFFFPAGFLKLTHMGKMVKGYLWP